MRPDAARTLLLPSLPSLYSKLHYRRSSHAAAGIGQRQDPGVHQINGMLLMLCFLAQSKNLPWMMTCGCKTKASLAEGASAS